MKNEKMNTKNSISRLRFEIAAMNAKNKNRKKMEENNSNEKNYTIPCTLLCNC